MNDPQRVEGDAHVLLGRFSEAIPFYRDDADSLARLLRLALAFGKLRTVTLLRAEGIAPSPSEYARFLRERALPALPIGGDVEGGFFVDESIARDVARELGEPLPKLLAETARSMIAGGSRHLAKLFVFANLAHDDELLELLRPALDARARRPRASLDALVRERAARDGGGVAVTLQQGDADDYNPKSAAVWIVEAGEREIWKEHLRLAIDYSRVDGYSEEREVMESADASDARLARLRGVVDLSPHELLRIELAPGVPLPEDAPLPRGEAIAVCAQVAAALERLHARGIAYLDVKPKNVLWDGRRATLVDLGAARRLGSAATVATLPGSPECVAPEIAREYRAGREADLYQLGLLAARLLTGRHPFAGHGISAPGDRSEALLRAALPALYTDPELGDLRPADPLRALTLALLEREPAARPRAREVRAELEALVVSFPRIHGTLGRTTDDPAVLAAMVRAGMGMARVNSAYATLEELGRRIDGLRAAGPVPLMLDLKGPQLRIACVSEREGPDGMVTVPVRYPIAKGDRVFVGFGAGPVHFAADFEDDLEVGDLVTFQNGTVRARVIDPEAVGIAPRAGAVLLAIEEAGEGHLAPQTGANVPGKRLSVPRLSARDHQAILLGVAKGAEWYALSFVRDAKDVTNLHEALVQAGDARAGVCVKIEERSGIARLEEIVAAVRDAGRPASVMVARGDLFVELAPEELPGVELDLVARARALGVPSIVATGLLLTMQREPRPARSEVCDVAAALRAGADALLLSDETSNGKHPVLAVEMLARLVAAYGVGSSSGGST